MKKIVLALLVFSSFLTFSQEEVLLRYNYKKGDKYLMEMTMKQNMGLAGGMDMKMDMHIEITEVVSGKTTMTSQVKKVDTEVMQGGQTMKYNSEAKEEELDAFGKQMKAQMDPLMKVVSTYTFDQYGKVLESKTEPSLGSNQTQIAYTNFPEKPVKVGSNWTTEQDQQGMKMKMTFTVKEITATSVIADISGTVNTMGIEGKLGGSTTINRASGNSDVINLTISMSAQGMTISMNSEVKMTKL